MAQITVTFESYEDLKEFAEKLLGTKQETAVQSNAVANKVEDVIINMVRAVSFLDTGGAIEATVDFDDSIIEDSNALIDKNIKLVNGGLRSKLTAIMEINKCSEAEATKELKRIKEDNQITGQDIDWTGGDDDELDEENDMSEEEEKDENQDSDDFKSGKTSDSGNKK